MVNFTPLHHETIGSLIDPVDVNDIEGSHTGLFDGVYCGEGIVNGKRVVFVIQDYSFRGGSFGLLHNKQITRSIEIAVESCCPLLFFLHTGGARIQDGTEGMFRSTQTLYTLCRASGSIPTIAVVNGTCAGLGAYVAATCDAAIFIRNKSKLFMTGPKVVQTAIGRKVEQEALGGTEVHANQTGTATHTVGSTAEAQQIISRLIRLLPAAFEMNTNRFFPATDKEARKPYADVLPTDIKSTYDVRRIIDLVSEPGSFIEYYSTFGMNLLTGLASFHGITIGIIANQPKILSGCMDVKSAHKLSRFMQICDAYDIPLLFLVDCPGFLPGEHQEHLGLVNAGSKAAQVLASCQCPRITVVTRRMTGGSYPVMNAKAFGADHMILWENAEITIMSTDAAGKVINDSSESSYSVEFMLENGFADEVIHPNDTSIAILKALQHVLQQPRPPALNKRRVILPM